MPIYRSRLKSILDTYLERIEKTSASIHSKSIDIDIDGIDSKRLLNLYDSKDHIGNIFKLYYNSQKDFRTDLNKVEPFSEPFNQLVHTLKGISSNIGAKQISKFCDDIEKSNDKEIVNILIKKLYAELDKLLSLIHQFIQDNEVRQKVDFDKQKDFEFLGQIHHKVKNNEFIEPNDIKLLVTILEHYSDKKELIESIRVSLDDFELDQADGSLASIIEEIKEI